MPTSNPKIISPILDYVKNNTPESILDIGIGFGKWGALLREYTDVLHYRFYKSQHIVKIHGIEIHELYRNPNWDHYNQIFIGNACELIKGLGFYELVVFTDVIEHIQKDRAMILMGDIFNRTKTLIVSYSNDEQDAVGGNDHEAHISQWQIEDFELFGDVTVLHSQWNQQTLLIKSKNI